MGVTDILYHQCRDRKAKELLLPLLCTHSPPNYLTCMLMNLTVSHLLLLRPFVLGTPEAFAKESKFMMITF